MGHLYTLYTSHTTPVLLYKVLLYGNKDCKVYLLTEKEIIFLSLQILQKIKLLLLKASFHLWLYLNLEKIEFVLIGKLTLYFHSN